MTKAELLLEVEEYKKRIFELELLNASLRLLVHMTSNPTPQDNGGWVGDTPPYDKVYSTADYVYVSSEPQPCLCCPSGPVTDPR